MPTGSILRRSNRRRQVSEDPSRWFWSPLTIRRSQLVKKLHKVQEHLKGYSHVNKKAFEQYTTFNKQRDSLLERRDELDASGESIQDLIETLDTRKDEAIERTFKQVSKYFSETFEKLVPAGRGKLRMLKKLDGEVSD